MDPQNSYDVGRLKELEDDFGAEDLGMIVEAFLEEASEKVDEIGTCLSEVPDADRVGHFHFLVGAARNIGAKSFGDMCQKHEQANDAFQQDDYSKLKLEFGALRSWYADRLGFED